jgi:hypothetical protein
METAEFIPFPPGLVSNEPWDPKPAWCGTCGSEGWIAKDDGRYDKGRDGAMVGVFEEMAPCPKCRLGYVIANGWKQRTREKKNGDVETDYLRRPTGWETFWDENGQLLAHAVRLADRSGERPLGADENKRRIREIRTRYLRIVDGENPDEDDSAGSLRRILVTDEAMTEFTRLMVAHRTPGPRKSIAEEAGLRQTEGGECPDCKGGGPLYSYGDVAVCDGCAKHRAQVALAAGETPPSGVWKEKS